MEKGCLVVNEEINPGKMGLKLYRGLVKPIAFYPFKEDLSCIRTLSPAAPPPNRQIASVLPVVICSAPPTGEEELNDPSSEITDTPDMTPNEVTETADKDVKAT
ncbi:hypothetical protein BDD12DRAFT_807599 [Trichophaea hybrida]|nr:hypothetical protein BDD12DRAFT_807599 [Trichophaea hybrida]